jgi:hypothetical protein
MNISLIHPKKPRGSPFRRVLSALFVLGMLLFASFIIVPDSAQANTATIITTSDFTPSHVKTVSKHTPTTVTTGEYVSLIQFSDANWAMAAYAMLDLSSIPSGSAILSATIYYTVGQNGQGTVSFYSISSAWNATTITWNTKPSYDPSNPVSASLSNGAQSANITYAVRQEYLGVGYGIAVIKPGGTIQTYATIDRVSITWSNVRELWKPHFTSMPPSAALGRSWSYTPVINESATITYLDRPSWATVSDATVSGTPTTPGMYPLSIRAISIPGTLAEYQNVTVTVRGWSPGWTTAPMTNIIAGTTYNYAPATNESATITAVSYPSWLSWTGSALTGIAPSGTFPVSLMAESAAGYGLSWQNFTIVVGAWGPAWLTTPSQIAYTDLAYSYSPNINESATITAVSYPSWMAWENDSLIGTPHDQDIGPGTVSFRATGGRGGLASWQNYTLTVMQRGYWMPMVTSVPVTKIPAATQYRYTVHANESFTLSYSGPSWITVEGNALTGTAPNVPQTGHISLAIISLDGGNVFWQNYSLEVWATNPAINNPGDAQAKAGSEYSFSFGGAGWASDYVLTYVQTNADWLSYNDSSVSGTPKIPGTYWVNATVTNRSSGLSTFTNWTISIDADRPDINPGGNGTAPHTANSTAPYADPKTGIVYTEPLDIVWVGYEYGYTQSTRDKRNMTVTWNSTAEWLSYNSTTQTYGGWPRIVGLYHVESRITNISSGAFTWENWSIQVKAIPPTITTLSESLTGLVNQPWSHEVAYTPNDAVVTWRSNASWIRYGEGNRTFYGVPDRAGVYYLALTVTNATTALSAMRNDTITIELDAPVIIASPLLKGQERVLYSWYVRSDQSAIWSMQTDATGWLVLDNTSGRLHGTPNAAGVYYVTLTATNHRGIASAPYSYNVTVTAPPNNNGGGGNDNGNDGTGVWDWLTNNVSYSNSSDIAGPVVGFLIVGLFLVWLMFRRRKN